MVRTVGKLSALTVDRAKRPGMYPDGGGLYLQVTGTGAKSWIFRFMLRRRAREMGLGRAGRDDVTLSAARAEAISCRQLLREGVDPIEARRIKREEVQLEAAQAMSFAECAAAFIESHQAGWRNAKHVEQWSRTLKTYAEPVFGALAVQKVDTALVMKALDPIWTVKTETASRVRGRIEAVLDWAATRGYRRGDNPARWRGHLENLLPRPSKVRPVKHHRALPYDEIGAFMERLRAEDGITAKAAQFLILTATRTTETLQATWAEIDLDDATWTIPPERIKAAKEHRVPLSAPALAILKSLHETRHGEFVFPGHRKGKPLSHAAIRMLLVRMPGVDASAHGFRSTFRDWVSERTNFSNETAEMALAHVIRDKAERAYRRGDQFQKRSRLMDQWARQCESPAKGEKVIPMGRRARA